MTMEIDAIYENGVLHPVGPLPLAEHQRVTVVISVTPATIQGSQLDVNYIEKARREVAKMERIPTLLEVQQRMSKIPGSMASEIIAEREDR